MSVHVEPPGFGPVSATDSYGGNCSRAPHLDSNTMSFAARAAATFEVAKIVETCSTARKAVRLMAPADQHSLLEALPWSHRPDRASLASSKHMESFHAYSSEDLEQACDFLRASVQ